MKVIVIDSVKGGCGKTSIALKCAICESQKEGNKVCFLDLDLLGSAIEMFVSGETFIGKSETEDSSHSTTIVGNEGVTISLKPTTYAEFHLNDLFKGVAFSDFFLSTINVNETNEGLQSTFSLIACDPRQNEKDRFKPSRMVNYIGQIDYDYFAGVIENVLKSLGNEDFTHVIIDMPPNSDAYTDTLFDILLRKSDSENTISTKYQTEIWIINSFDRAHFTANVEWLISMHTEHNMQWAVDTPNLFKIVFNDTIDYNNSIIKPSKDELVQNRLNMLKQYGIPISCAYIYDYDSYNVVCSTRTGGIGFANANDPAMIQLDKSKF